MDAQPDFIELIEQTKQLRDRLNTMSGGLQNITITIGGSDVVVAGNRAGLVELARVALIVAQKDTPGAHQDIDETTFASKANGILTIALDNRLS